MMTDSNYSITAYHIQIKERQKFYHNHKKSDAIDKSHYLKSPYNFMCDFIAHITANKINNRSSYFYVSDVKDIMLPNLIGKELFVRFGKAGQDFLTVEPEGKERQFGKDTKIVKYYRIFFFKRTDDNNCFMVIFRNGVNSCKTIVYDEMRDFLSETNILVNLPYVSNNEYINNLCRNMTLVSLNYATKISVSSPDNADNNSTIWKKYSDVTIDLSIEKTKSKFQTLLENLLFGNDKQNKKQICDILSYNVNGGNKDDGDMYIVDEESLSVLINMDGVKRTIKLRDFLSFYDVDITSKLDEDQNGNPTNESIMKEIIEYVSGIEIPEDE